ncbi:hypothetical protein GCM10009555_057060 [Acrocarpospora macrocephala]|uniref:HTH cro/C1-type domain-containing protein n=1 Tax=Acrocarpospora macrocephala TaxID=150177 RepID=A0A5M3WQ78_9ACTN|nr:helix-turn-helix transcriptional regulator [Acrocarpospora macrocephala]GES08408.1 hypothetical protein Amac_020040 [Acrocarpospora macrocephala]
MDSEPPRRRSPGRLHQLPSDVPLARAALVTELRRGRDLANLSLQELAKEMFSSKATVSRWLNARALPDQKQALRWAQLCGTDDSVMLDLWERASTESATLPAIEPEKPEKSRRNLRVRLVAGVLAGMVALIAAVIVIWIQSPDRPPCAVDYPISLYVPPQSGEVMDVTVEVKCGLPPDRRYFIVEEVPNVDVRNPHPAYYVKAVIAKTRIGESTVIRMLLKEPVGIRAKFYVISVDASGERELEQNRIVDNGLLDLPGGTRQESAVSWHVKAWQ